MAQDARLLDLATHRQVRRFGMALRAGAIGLLLCGLVAVDLWMGVDLAVALHLWLAAWLMLCAYAWVRMGQLETFQAIDRVENLSLVLSAPGAAGASYLMGGVAWVGPLALTLVLLAAAFADDRRTGMLTGVLTIASFVAVTVAEGVGLLPSLGPLRHGGAADDAGHVAASAIILTLGLALLFIIGSVVQIFVQLQRQLLEETSRELQESKRELESINDILGARVAERTKELEGRNRELSVMADLGQIANSSLDVQDFYLVFMREARKLIDFDLASIAVYSADGERLRLLRVRLVDGELTGDPFELDAASSLQASREPRLIGDFREEGNYAERDYLLRHGAACGVTVPLVSKDVLLGSFNAVSNTPGRFDGADLELMERMAEPLALALSNARLFEEARALADSDPLTGLPNLRTVRRLAQSEIARTERRGEAASVLVMDIDNFKSINDSLGHQAGDELLLKVAEILRDACRESDVVGRRSGDEFIVLLPEAGPEDAFSVAQRIHEALAESGWTYPGREGVAVTTSVGVAAYPRDGAVADELLNRADRAMYQAKRAGGGGTRLASDLVDEDPSQGGPRQMRFGLLETLANVVAAQLAEAGTRQRTLAAFTGRAVLQIAEAAGLDEAEQRVLRVSAMSHALGIFPAEDPDGHPDNFWGLDERIDETYLKLGRLFVLAAQGLDEASHAVHYHHRPAAEIGFGDEMRLARILAVGEAYARLTMPGADPQLTPAEALAALARDGSLDQSCVELLARSMLGESAARAA